MIYLFVIFFILEFIVVSMICYGIYVLDRKVIALSETFKVNRHTLKFQLRALYDTANRFKLKVKCQKRAIEEQRRLFIRKMIKGILISMALFFFKKTRFRKKILFVELLLVLYDTLRADCRI
ncbi:hypothetical protein IJ707_02230 [bacterium]|nr:hypothetical protein [bacterium]